jgi:bifunctional UDP-N-acetylglucosamine pyrophosphorylase/glucosamine-1-phosphate N-acetyltransferase
MKHPSPIPTAAIILAAGRGTRMKSELPKVMHQVASRAMVGHVMYAALDAGLSPLTLVVAPGMHTVRSYAVTVDESVRVAVQEEPLGTGHAVKAARESLKDFEGNLLVLYGDTPLLTSATITQLNEALNDDARCAVVVLGFTPEHPGDYGRLILAADGSLERIVEARDASAHEAQVHLCNSGVMALRGSVAWDLIDQIQNKNKKGEYYLTDIVALARKAGYSARVIEGAATEVLGVNSRGELALAEAAMQARLRAAHMENGATLRLPETVFFSADTRLGQDVTIEPNVFFGTDVAVGNGATIRAFSHIEGTVIGEGAVVGPFARLRPGTNLGEKVKIGNFVEIKKSEIAAGAKISHLSYIGDASVGEDANIGAGTITCNYDGYQKHRTTIGRDVFIGSNTALIAPVTIGEGAMVAAGSVITADIAPDALALARTRQEQKQDWAKEFRERQKKQRGTD